MSFKSMALAAAVMLTTVSSLGAAGARRAAAVRAACRGGPRSTLTAGHGTRSPFALAGHQAGPRSARAFEYVPVSALDRGHRAADLLRYQVGQRAQIENEVRGSRNHQRLLRWTGHVPKLVMLADVSLLLYFIGAITDVNWASPLPVNPAFAMLLAAMAITLSYGFLAFAHYRLHGYKDHPGAATPVALARAYVISCARSLALESVPGLLSARTGRRRDPRSTATAGRCASWLSVLAVGCADPRSSQTVPRRVPSRTGHRTVQPGWTG